MARFFSKRGSSYRGRRTSRRRTRVARGYGAARRRVTMPRFALQGFARDVEKKYFDTCIAGLAMEMKVGQTTNPVNISGGAMWDSTGWRRYDFAGPGQILVNHRQPNNLLYSLPQGASANSRVGNKIRPVYLKGVTTFTAATIADIRDMGGEDVGDSNTSTDAEEYLRTTYRFVVVKDTMVNNPTPNVTWNDVFENRAQGMGGVHSDLLIANMGRFVVLEDKLIQLDAKNPQKTIKWSVTGSKIGRVRYNSGETQALLDKGICVIYSAFTVGLQPSQDYSNVELPNVVTSARLCFTDA